MSEQNELGIEQLELQAAEAKLLRRYREGKLRLKWVVGYRNPCWCNAPRTVPNKCWLVNEKRNMLYNASLCIGKVVLPDGREFCIDSLSWPKLYRDRFTLLGWARHRDMCVCKRYFRTEENRARFMADLEYALADWSENWPGWSTVVATTPSQTVEVLTL